MGVFHFYSLLFSADSNNISLMIDVEAFCQKMKNKFINFNFPMKCIPSNLSVSCSATSSDKMLTWWETYPSQIQ